MLFESTRPVSLALQQNKNLSVLSYVEAFWWARVDVASRAAKNSPPGCFCAIFNDVAAAVRIRPLSPEKVLITFNYKDGTKTITFDEIAAKDAPEGNGSDLGCFAPLKMLSV